MINRIADWCGYVLIRKKKSPTLVTHLASVIKELEIDLVVDVGANKGQFGKLLRALGYQGNILSFEPVATVFEVLRENASGDENWNVMNIALGDKKDSVLINVFPSSDFSSILGSSKFGEEAFSVMRRSSRELIDVDVLDSILQARGLLGKRILLKMDTQGYDLNVFRGASGSMRSILALLSEISFQPIYENMPDYHVVLQEYAKAGFGVSGLYPVSKNRDGTIIEMDCVLVRKQGCANETLDK